MKYDPLTTNRCPKAYKAKLGQMAKKFEVNRSRIAKRANVSSNIFLEDSLNILWEPDLVKVLDIFHIPLATFKEKPVDTIMGAWVDPYFTQKNKKGRKPGKLLSEGFTQAVAISNKLPKLESPKKSFSIESTGTELIIKISL